MDSAAIHHVELWLPELGEQLPGWNWLFGELGWKPYQHWEIGQSWRAADGSYVVIEQSPDLEDAPFRRTRAGINHLALTAPQAIVDRVAASAPTNGWTLLFAHRHPHAGGADHYAAYLENVHGFEVELVAT
ncbi:glyoxalase [Microlunatus elymi]|uniref:Glyoxalase n=1 Tax=Microlunatus elymi TaxID=2596828 RepID=A0A516Q1G5_9ACTN|nr:VOC family protein [Microlunatus elymi]QDP97270.1 glyoxalase [Microlunatus elymi]